MTPEESGENYDMNDKKRHLSVGFRLLWVVGVVVVGMNLLYFGKSFGDARSAVERTVGESLENQYLRTLQSIRDKSWSAYSLAEWVSRDGKIVEAFAARDRERLRELTLPIYESVKGAIQVDKFQFHLAPATSFLRLHKPEKWGDDLSEIRPTVVHTNTMLSPTLGLDQGRYGMGIRGIVPVFKAERHIGSVEFGMAVGDGLLEPMVVSRIWQLAVWIPDGAGGYREQAGTGAIAHGPEAFEAELDRVMESGEAVTVRREDAAGAAAYYLGPLPDYLDASLGVLVIRRDISELLAEEKASLATVVGIGLGSTLLVLLLIWLMVRQLVGQRLGRVMGTADGVLEQRDLTLRVPIKQKRWQDEVDRIGEAFNRLVEGFGAILSQQRGGSGTVLRSADQLQSTAGELEAEANRVAGFSKEAGGVTREMAERAGRTVEEMRQASGNVSGVSAAAEEMNATIREISESTEKARRTTESAVEEVGAMSRQMQNLGEAAGAIDKVTETISAISEQINLLALNATIEAARAGEAGKGFQVVAGEIKTLAQQTSESSEDIKQRIHSIQESIEDNVGRSERIRKVIDEVDQSVMGTASAMEQQTSTTQEIARNIAEVTQLVEETAEAAGRNSEGMHQVSERVAEITSAMETILRESDGIGKHASELERMARELESAIRQYRLE